MSQHIKWRQGEDHIILTMHGSSNLSTCQISSTDVNSFVMAIVELHSSDMKMTEHKFSRVNSYFFKLKISNVR